MNQYHAIAYIRQLCCAGLAKEVMIPEFLRAVTKVIPSHNNVFSNVDESLTPANFILGFSIDEKEALVISQVTAQYWSLPERASNLMHYLQDNAFITEPEIVDPTFFQSDLYNLVYKPFELHHVLLVYVMANGLLAGGINLYRPPTMKPFSKEEGQLFLRILPYFSHALAATSAPPIVYCEQGDTGMIVMNSKGDRLYLCPAAKRLMALAAFPFIGTDIKRQQRQLHEKLAQLCRNLDAIYRNKQAPPPSFNLTNNRGRFVFRAYWLEQQTSGPGNLIGMTIEHREPLLLKILRALQLCALSPSQMEVAALVAQGYPNETIAQRLHIKPTTVKDHVQNIFNKLNIDKRTELLPKLFAMETSYG